MKNSIKVLLLIFLFTPLVATYGQKLKKPLHPSSAQTDGKVRRFSVAYQAAFYYDKDNPTLFPIGLDLEYMLGMSNTSLDLQTIFYHPKATHSDTYGYYRFLSQYFLQYDLGLRFYFDQFTNENIGIYIRPSIGVVTNYYKEVIHDQYQNMGFESTKLTGKNFFGFQVGTKNRFNKHMFFGGSIGTLLTYFNNGNEKIFLFSPHINFNLGVSF
jgi:hypothetical protein